MGREVSQNKFSPTLTTMPITIAQMKALMAQNPGDAKALVNLMNAEISKQKVLGMLEPKKTAAKKTDAKKKTAAKKTKKTASKKSSKKSTKKTKKTKKNKKPMPPTFYDKKGRECYYLSDDYSSSEESSDSDSSDCSDCSDSSSSCSSSSESDSE